MRNLAVLVGTYQMHQARKTFQSLDLELQPFTLSGMQIPPESLISFSTSHSQSSVLSTTVSIREPHLTPSVSKLMCCAYRFMQEASLTKHPIFNSLFITCCHCTIDEPSSSYHWTPNILDTRYWTTRRRLIILSIYIRVWSPTNSVCPRKCEILHFTNISHYIVYVFET